MGQTNVTKTVNQFKRTFAEDTLNELGKVTRLCQRERIVTPASARVEPG